MRKKNDTEHHILICTSHTCDFLKKIPYGNDLESFCPKCGKELAWACSSCQKPIANEFREFCSWCGDPLVKE